MTLYGATSGEAYFESLPNDFASGIAACAVVEELATMVANMTGGRVAYLVNRKKFWSRDEWRHSLRLGQKCFFPSKYNTETLELEVLKDDDIKELKQMLRTTFFTPVPPLQKTSSNWERNSLLLKSDAYRL